MKSEYRFRHPTGRLIQVTCAHIPGRWFSTGTHDMREAILWSEHKLKQDLQGRKIPSKQMTLNEFAAGFFSKEDPLGFRMRNEKRNKIYSEHYYFAHQSRLDNYILPEYGGSLVSAFGL